MNKVAKRLNKLEREAFEQAYTRDLERIRRERHIASQSLQTGLLIGTGIGLLIAVKMGVIRV